MNIFVLQYYFCIQIKLIYLALIFICKTKHDVVFPYIAVAQDVSHLGAGLHKSDDFSVARVALQPLAVFQMLLWECALHNFADEQTSVCDPWPHQIGTLALEEPVLAQSGQRAQPAAVGAWSRKRGGVQNCCFAHR